MSTAIEIEIDKIQILIADDHPVVRAGLKQILADNPDIVVGGEAVDAQEVIEKIREEEWDVVILDYAMPGG
nr:response regulator transcription factor [Leptospiraceae bacterium]